MKMLRGFFLWPFYAHGVTRQSRRKDRPPPSSFEQTSSPEDFFLFFFYTSLVGTQTWERLPVMFRVMSFPPGRKLPKYQILFPAGSPRRAHQYHLPQDWDARRSPSPVQFLLGTPEEPVWASWLLPSPWPLLSLLE